MALLQRSCNRFGSVITHMNVRALSKTDLTVEKNIKKSVFISQSNDIYTNLALEEWLYKNFNFKNHHVLMLWQNEPSVVIGRNQNPWSETNFSGLQNITEDGVNLARRSSSGGALYHDNGSLNLTFFTPRERYNSRYNVDVVARSIFREFGCKVEVGADDDLFLRNNKQISNKAAKLGRDNSYHNMSLMVKSNKINRNLALQKHDVNIKSNARQLNSVSMMNLCEETPQVTISSLMKAVGWEFLRTKALTVKDGGMELAQNQKGFHMINPTENWFPGLNEIRDSFSSWDWCYGKSPEFNITQTFSVPMGLMHSNNTGASANLNVTMTVKHGKIADITLYVPSGLSSFGFTGEAKVVHNLKGKRFSVQAFEDLEDSLGCLLDEKDKFVTECLKQVMTCA